MVEHLVVYGDLNERVWSASIDHLVAIGKYAALLIKINHLS